MDEIPTLGKCFVCKKYFRIERLKEVKIRKPVRDGMVTEIRMLCPIDQEHLRLQN